MSTADYTTIPDTSIFSVNTIEVERGREQGAGGRGQGDKGDKGDKEQGAGSREQGE
ncbi:MAG: hypothetical protein ACRAVC_02985 [Trichormus sp.]